VLDAYATSYFNAWLDYGGLYKRKADFWVAFIPRFLVESDNAARFFADYPDGRLIIPVRDPVSWPAVTRANIETSSMRRISGAAATKTRLPLQATSPVG
jgi:hypothetical protein